MSNDKHQMKNYKKKMLMWSEKESNWSIMSISHFGPGFYS